MQTMASPASSTSEECNKSFCSNYMLLKPEEASLVDTVSILFSSDIGKRKFVDCPDGARASCKRRWIIFVSVMVMKLLQVTAKPLAGLGWGLEHWLNLLSVNKGFFRLILNFFKGKVVYPDEVSAGFLSFIGNMDRRVELDTKIKPGDKGYHAEICVMAAKISYENPNFIQNAVRDHWKMDLIGFYDFWNDYQGKSTTQAFVMDDNRDTIVVTFRGTETFDADAWSTDFDISWYEIPGVGRIHGGFMKALGLQKSKGWPHQQAADKPQTAYYAIRKLLAERLQKNDKARFVVTGHSLGGALAALFPAILAFHKEEALLQRLAGVYTYGQPRVGDDKFGEFMKKAMRKYDFSHYRFVYSFDIVPRLPYDDSALMFEHFGTCVYYNSFYHGKVVAEQPDKNYFSILWILPKFLNACWELIRSFIIPYTRGPDYKETGLIRTLRVVGLLIAGVPAHCPPEYVNSMRLGSPNVFTSMHAHQASKSQ